MKIRVRRRKISWNRNETRENGSRRTRLFSRVIYPSKRVREATPIHRSSVHRAMTRSTPSFPSPPPPPSFPPESMLHEFTADSETTRSLSRNTALQPILVELPRFVNDKGSNRERYFPSRDQSPYGLLRTGKRFLSRQTSPISDSTRGNGTRERERELDIRDFVYIYIHHSLKLTIVVARRKGIGKKRKKRGGERNEGRSLREIRRRPRLIFLWKK